MGENVAIPDEEFLNLVPDGALDDVTAALFGGGRLSAFTMEYPDSDASLLGVEQHDSATAIPGGREPEVTGKTGLRSLAMVMGSLESDPLQRPLTVDEVLADEKMPYQAQIEA